MTTKLFHDRERGPSYKVMTKSVFQKYDRINVDNATDTVRAVL
jgi:hypothetical protein